MHHRFVFIESLSQRRGSESHVFRVAKFTRTKAVLQGARRLLQQHRVGCALVQTYLRQDITGPVVRVLRSSGYTVSNYSYAIPENAFQLVAGSPADALALAGGSACGRRFFQWWLGENREIESDCKMKKEQGRDREERPTQRQNCTGTSRFAQTYRTRAHTHKSHHSGWEPRT